MTRPRNKADGRYIDRTLEASACPAGEHTADRAGASQPCLRCGWREFYPPQPRVGANRA